MNRLVILGASGHGKVVSEIAEIIYPKAEILFLDDAKKGSWCNCKIVGNTENFVDYLSDSYFFIAIGDCKIRRKMQEKMEFMGAKFATLIHPSAIVSKNAEVSPGTVIMAGAVINADCVLNKGVIINTCSSVDHDSIIGNYCHVSVGAHIAGNVVLGEAVFIGAGATVINNIKIADDSIVGAGAAVVSDITETGTYVGVPARRKK